MLNEEVARYEEITGEDASKVSIERIGAFLDGYEKAMETYKWNYRPEGGWTEETLPDVGKGVLFRRHSKVSGRTRTEVVDEWRKEYSSIFMAKTDLVEHTEWMYIPPVEEF